MAHSTCGSQSPAPPPPARVQELALAAAAFTAAFAALLVLLISPSGAAFDAATGAFGAAVILLLRVPLNAPLWTLAGVFAPPLFVWLASLVVPGDVVHGFAVPYAEGLLAGGVAACLAALHRRRTASGPRSAPHGAMRETTPS